MKKNLLLILTLSFFCLNANENQTNNEMQEDQTTANQQDSVPTADANRAWYDPIKNGYYSALSVMQNLVNKMSSNNSNSQVADQLGDASGEAAQDFLDDYLTLPTAIAAGQAIDNAVTGAVDFAVEQVNNFLGSDYGQNITDVSNYHCEIVDNMYKISLPNLVRNNSVDNVSLEMVDSMLNVNNRIPVSSNVFVVVSYLLNAPAGMMLDLANAVVEITENRLNLSMPMLAVPSVEDVQSLDVPEVVPVQPEVPAVENLDANTVVEEATSELPAVEDASQAEEAVESLVDGLSNLADRSHNVSGHLKISVYSK